MTIGLVLFAKPRYSEKFFFHLISHIGKMNADLIILTDNDASSAGFFRRNIGKMRCFFYPKSYSRLIRLYQLNKSDNFDLKQNLLSLFSSMHIIFHDVDVLHFGFLSVAKHRENLALAMSAEMIVSVRGFDISIVPLKSQDYYKVLWKKDLTLHYISDDLYNLCKRDGFGRDSAAIKISPAIDTNLFSFSAKSMRSNDENIVFLTVGRLHWKKGHDLVLYALAEFKLTQPNFIYYIAGVGDYHEYLMYLTNLLNLEDNVVFLGEVDHSDLPTVYRNCDFYIQYSLQEGFCNAVLEAQSCGCFCIVSDAEGLSENVLHEKTGFVVPKNSKENLLEGLTRAVNLSSYEYQRLTKAASLRVSNEFSLDIQLQKFRKLYFNV